MLRILCTLTDIYYTFIRDEASFETNKLFSQPHFKIGLIGLVVRILNTNTLDIVTY